MHAEALVTLLMPAERGAVTMTRTHNRTLDRPGPACFGRLGLTSDLGQLPRCVDTRLSVQPAFPDKLPLRPVHLAATSLRAQKKALARCPHG